MSAYAYIMQPYIWQMPNFDLKFMVITSKCHAITMLLYPVFLQMLQFKTAQ
jgi:hypothetical protein